MPRGGEPRCSWLVTPVQLVNAWRQRGHVGDGRLFRGIGRPVPRYELESCRAWLAARPKRQRCGRALNGGTVRLPLAVGLKLGMRDQLRRVAAEHEVSISTLLGEGGRRVLMALGKPVDPPERLPHLRDDHPFRRI